MRMATTANTNPLEFPCKKITNKVTLFRTFFFFIFFFFFDIDSFAVEQVSRIVLSQRSRLVISGPPLVNEN